jgi:hypothetical protein
MSVEQSVEWELAGGTEVLGENLPPCQSVHHKSNMSSSNPGRCGGKQANNRLRYGTAFAVVQFWRAISSCSAWVNKEKSEAWRFAGAWSRYFQGYLTSWPGCWLPTNRVGRFTDGAVHDRAPTISTSLTERHIGRTPESNTRVQCSLVRETKRSAGKQS